VSQWADQYRKLSSESSAQQGQWRTDFAPYQRDIMNAWNDPTVHTIVWKKSAQVGATEVLNNIIGWIMHQNPGPILMMQPTTSMAETWSKIRLAPMLRDSPCFSQLFGQQKSRDASNTTLEKTFPGGYIGMIGANSPSGMASRPVPNIFNDEVNRYPASAGDEGDPVELTWKRAQTFWNKKRALTSTPTVEGASRISTAYNGSDQRLYYVPCPECKHKQVLQWSNLRWPENQPEHAYYECEACQSKIDHRQKRWMVANGEWLATRAFKGIAGFWINELYSPWSSWGSMAETFLAVKDDPFSLKTFINTALGQDWVEEGQRLAADDLQNRVETYDSEAPTGCVVITAGVDVQDDRLECEVVGWGQGHESWSLAYVVIYGNPGQADIWLELDEFLSTRYGLTNGHTLRVVTTCIDSGGHYTSQVYRFCKQRENRRIYAIKGTSVPGAAVLHTRSRKNDGNVLLFGIGTETIKEIVFGRLTVKEAGPGYCHFSDHNDDRYFDQLTSEERVTEYHKGVPRKTYRRIKNRRNEALDCRVYAEAARHILNPQYDALAARLAKPVEQPVKAIVAEPDPLTEAHQERIKKPMKRKPGGFVNGWR
jgi:phage terminase large subunit GpA-like protein